MIYTFLSGISGGFLYFILKGLYQIKILENKVNNIQIKSWKQLINFGFIIGAIIGFIRDYNGVPVIEFIKTYL